MIHVETPGMMSVDVSEEMVKRINYVKTFFIHTKRRPTNEMVAAYGIASLGDLVSIKSSGKIFCSLRGGIKTPFSFAKIRSDMSAPTVTNYNLAEPPPEVMNTIKEIRKKFRLRNEKIVLLGVGFLSDVIERFVAGEVILVGTPNSSLGEMVEYESDAIRGYRPVLVN